MYQVLEKLTYYHLQLTYYFKGLRERYLSKYFDKYRQLKYVKIHCPKSNYNIKIDLNAKFIYYTGRMSAGMRGRYKWPLNDEQIQQIYRVMAKFSVLSLPQMKERPNPLEDNYVGFHRIVFTSLDDSQNEIHFNIDERKFFENNICNFLALIEEITGLRSYTTTHYDRRYNFFLVRVVDTAVTYAISANSKEVAKEVVYYNYLFPTNLSLQELEVLPLMTLEQSSIQVVYPYKNIWDLFTKKSPRIDLRKNSDTQKWEVLVLERYYNATGFYDAQLQMIILILGLEHKIPIHTKPPHREL